MTVARQKKQNRANLLDDFKSLYGSKPVVIAQMWVDLQITPEEHVAAVLVPIAMVDERDFWSNCLPTNDDESPSPQLGTTCPFAVIVDFHICGASAFQPCKFRYYATLDQGLATFLQLSGKRPIVSPIRPKMRPHARCLPDIALCFKKSWTLVSSTVDAHSKGGRDVAFCLSLGVI
jgi:hypothetical protein